MSRKGAASKAKGKVGSVKQGGKKESNTDGAQDAAIDGGAASRSETRAEIHDDEAAAAVAAAAAAAAAAALPAKHSAGDEHEGVVGDGGE